MRIFPTTSALLIVSIPLLVGCTPEKAEALLTAIKAFETQSNQALTSYEELFKEYRKLNIETQDELFISAYEGVNQQGVTNSSFQQAVDNIGKLKTTNSENKIEREFLELKSLYVTLSNTYTSLPQGSLIGAQYVSCGQNAVAKLTKQLVNFSSEINNSPLYPIALHQDFSEFKNLAVKGSSNKDAARKKYDAFYSGIHNYETKHADAIAKTLIAVELGQQLNKLLAKYDEITISSILEVIQYSISFSGTMNGVDISQSAARLKVISGEMDKSEYWKRIETIPISSVTQCQK